VEVLARKSEGDSMFVNLQCLNRLEIQNSTPRTQGEKSEAYGKPLLTIESLVRNIQPRRHIVDRSSYRNRLDILCILAPRLQEFQSPTVQIHINTKLQYPNPKGRTYSSAPGFKKSLSESVFFGLSNKGGAVCAT
jgi:hypothetical protein